MKKYLYILASLALLLVGCIKSDADALAQKTNEDIVTLALELKLQDADIHSIETRAAQGSAWANKENVTKITGYALVFGNDPNSNNIYGDDSPLLQKVAFKSVNFGSTPTIYVTLDKQTDPCFIRLMTSMTQPIRDEIEGFISQKQINEGESGEVTTFADYKHISVSLAGYYNLSDPVNDTPDPGRLTPNLAFPLASPGINMPTGLDEITVEAVNKIAYMVPIASKVDVTSKCKFDLQQVTLLNGARFSRLRSTVITNDGLDVIYTLPLPINLGGVTPYKAVNAIGGTTADTPIYFFPNEGDGPFNEPADPENEYPANGTKLSDEINSKNPTYLIVKGRADGYDVDGYYKIAIEYKVEIIGPDGLPSGTYSPLTYDIVRNNHYRVNLNKVDNPGYATFAEAVAGPANNIAYDITIGGGANDSQADHQDDPRAEVITSHNGFFYLQVIGTEVFAQGYGTEGVTGGFDLKLVRNQNIPSGYDVPTLQITATEGITINNNSSISDDDFAGAISFTATKSGVITLRCGDMLKEIPLHYEPTPHVWQSGSTLGGATLSEVSEFVADDSQSANDSEMITSSGSIAENSTFKNREFRGRVYPSDMSKGIRKVYCKQASNFELNTFYDNRAASATGGNSGSNNIFSSVELGDNSSRYAAAINYQSTGKVYQVDGENRGSLNDESIMDEWWIGASPIEFSTQGEFSTQVSGSLSGFNLDGGWDQLSSGATVKLRASDIGHNQLGGEYDPDRYHISNEVELTLTNIAGQSKSFALRLDQFAAPYISDESVIYDPTTDLYTWNCPLVADINLSLGGNNSGEFIFSPTVYNAHYKSGAEGVGDWSWSVAPTEGDWRGGSNGVSYVKKAFKVTPVSKSQDDQTILPQYYFKVLVYDDDALIRTNWQAYFDLKLYNGAAERIFFRFRLRRDD